MKAGKFLVAVMIVGASVLVTATMTRGDDEKKEGGAAGGGSLVPMTPVMSFDEYMKLNDPGPQHKLLTDSAGTWDLTLKMWMMGPTMPPVESKATSEIRAFDGGKFVTEDTSGEYKMPDMATGEMKAIPMKGHGVMGYDNYKRMFVGTWMDNLGTQLLTMKGQISPDGKVLTMYGEMDEPMLGMQDRMVKYVTRYKSKDERVFEIYDLAAGDDHKVFEITYKRKK